MKLRNKKTGEIGELQITEKYCAVAVGNGTASCGIEIYSSLAELNEEWQDYEEPKKWFTINKFDGSIQEINDDTCAWTDEEKNSIAELGFRFETEEEAEKAAEKLKAWKRLRDKGFRFTAWYGGSKNIDWEITSLENETYIPRQVCDDLDLLFGGEE